MTAEAVKHPGINLGAHHAHAHDRAETLVFGFWVFLMSDLIIFGLMFANYVTQLPGTAGGPGPKDLFTLGNAFTQTMILLASSATFGMASLALKYERGKGALLGWLAVTLALGAVFVGLEKLDFADMFSEGAYPSRSGFLSGFFGLVPLHGLHVASGILWGLVLMVQIATLGLTTPVKTRLLRLGLFWHFLDIIWIGIFSVVYLGGVA
ncbi:cytochrome o ubiquinol oxidase subunit III (plasmid) [Thioclava nitratireducens]|uniref:Cytochrome o ubiquinol oxidase subunit III n=1 Tax=Thioclava nitratireducens TaxID=1915078 RepID=A0ABN4XLC8_9RHOB|nr:cytochrome c oxidase subunit 3 [Thioclava nitratireducens]AQS50093.1 cytochrome o ubiquinol oxidase subunit III [Thioclava nitratireducens]